MAHLQKTYLLLGQAQTNEANTNGDDGTSSGRIIRQVRRYGQAGRCNEQTPAEGGRKSNGRTNTQMNKLAPTSAQITVAHGREVAACCLQIGTADEHFMTVMCEGIKAVVSTEKIHVP